MKFATKSLHLSALLGSCFFASCENLPAADRAVGTVPRESVNSAHADAVQVTRDERLAPNEVTEVNLQETLPTPRPARPSAVEPVPQLSIPPSIPRAAHLPHDPCVPSPRAVSSCLNESTGSVGELVAFPGMATLAATFPYQHPAPEVVLRFSRGCTDAAFSNWSLSSRNAPRSCPAIPHGPLLVALGGGVEPVDFVELLLDGKPLASTVDATVSPLTYDVPCPAVGRHVLQARYLSGNIWSDYSNALRFEVRLPQQPQIIALADFDRDPTPLVRNTVNPITTDSIKVHLSNVDRGDRIVAYVDGKPVSSRLDEQSCCRIINVEGFIVPGVHKLTVRTVGCPGACSISSRPSNEVLFHYYDEDIYLLRPSSGCDNKSPAIQSNCAPAQSAAMSGRQLNELADRAHAQSTDSVSAISRTSDAEREALAAGQRAEAALRQADIDAANFPTPSAQASVAHRAAAATRAERDAAHTAASEARAAYYAAINYATKVAAIAGEADLHAKAALASTSESQHQAQAAAQALELTMQARDRAEQATVQLLAALRSGADSAVVAANFAQAVSAAKLDAERQTREAKRYAANAIAHASAAENSARLSAATVEPSRLMAQAASQAEDAKRTAVEQAHAATRSAALAGRSHQLQAELKDAWDNAEVASMQDELLRRIGKASQSDGDVDVQRAEEGASVAELSAARAEARSAARIREYEANARMARANNVNAPPSPYYFASAAHFPMREFGLRGEPLDREGVIIYEDMALHFDRNGNYEVHFRASGPQVPATLRLQFHVQTGPDRPWYTITLAPIEFPFPPTEDQRAASCGTNCRDPQAARNCCGEVRTCVCKGHSEILRRCYGEMGPNARIRRSGTARFGFGVDVP